MARNKVVYFGETLMDITDTTSVASDVAKGTYFYTSDGNRQEGTHVDSVTSVNNKTGDVVLDATDVGALPDTTTIPTKTSDLTNDSGYITSAPVTSVNNQTGDITLSASDVGALPDTTVIPVQSVNGMTGNVVVPDPFMLLDFNQIINVSIPSCLNDIPNTSITNVDVSITDEIGADWAIASLAKYEVFDAETGGNRINVFPVCMFSMNRQKTLRLRMMAAGPNEKSAKRISGALLLKHR